MPLLPSGLKYRTVLHHGHRAVDYFRGAPGIWRGLNSRLTSLVGKAYVSSSACNNPGMMGANVNAKHFAKSIDTSALHKALYGGGLKVRKRVVFPPSWFSSDSEDSFAVVYKYGSIVYLNCDEMSRQRIDDKVKSFCFEANLGDLPDEDITVRTDPSLTGWGGLNNNVLTIPRLDVRHVEAISDVLGQTVALEYHERKVDDILEEFDGMKENMVKKSGKFDMEKRKLFRLIASNNQILSELIAPSSLALLDSKRPGRLAWDEKALEVIQTTLRKEYELQQRFQILDHKHSLIKNHTKFFVGALSSRYESWQEWVIIWLLVVSVGECMF